MVSAVILIQRTTPEAILKFHDQLTNELPTVKGKWSFSFRIYRNNIYSIDPKKSENTTVSDESKFLHTLTPSYLQGNTIALVNRRSVGIFSETISEEVKNNNPEKFSIPEEHLNRGAMSGLNDPFDYFVSQKLQSLWTQRQNIRGDSGNIYELENGNLIIRTSNISLHGNFQGLLIQLEVSENAVKKSAKESTKELLQDVIEKYGIPMGNMSYSVLDEKHLDKFGDLCLQYSEILNI